MRDSRQSENNNTVGSQIDLRKLFEHLQTLKNEIGCKIGEKNYVDAILVINKSLTLAKKFYPDDHHFVSIIHT
jgi:hypothetical protein